MEIKNVLEFKAVTEFSLTYQPEKLINKPIYLIPNFAEGYPAIEFTYLSFPKNRRNVKLRDPNNPGEITYADIGKLYWRFPEKEYRLRMEELLKLGQHSAARDLQREILADYRPNHFMIEYFQRDYNRRIEILEELARGQCSYCGCTCKYKGGKDGR